MHCLCDAELFYTDWDPLLYECGRSDCECIQCIHDGDVDMCEQCNAFCCEKCFGSCDFHTHHRLPEQGCLHCNPHLKLADDVILCADYFTSQIADGGEISWCSECKTIVDNTVHLHKATLEPLTLRQAIETGCYKTKCQFCEKFYIVSKMCEACKQFCCVICDSRINNKMEPVECYECELFMS